MRKVAFWLSIILIFTLPWENVVNFEGLGTISRVVGYAVALFWVATVIVTGRFRKLHLFHLVVCLFFLWNVVSVFWSVNINKTVDRSLTGLQLAGLILILWDLYITPAMLKSGLQAYVFGAYVAVANTIASYLANTAFYPNRYAAAGFNVNDLAIILALGIPVAWHLAVSEAGSRVTPVLRIVNYAYIPAAILAIFLTGSRTALAASLPTFLYILGSLTRLKLHVRILAFTALVVALLALQALVPAASFQRMASTGTELTEGDLNGRLEIWQDGIVSFSAHPLVGIGSGTFADITQSGKVGHDLMLSLLVEVGLIGFGFFVVIMAITFYEAIHQPKWNSWLWLTILIILLFGFATHNLEYRKQTWLFLSMVIVSANLIVQQSETALAKPLARIRRPARNWIGYQP